MRLVTLASTLIFLASMNAFAKAAKPADFDWSGPNDMTEACGNAVVTKLAEDKEVASYLEPSMSLSLEWYDGHKDKVSFTFNFDEDVRDGYMTGEIAVHLNADGTCKPGKVVNSSVGD